MLGLAETGGVACQILGGGAKVGGETVGDLDFCCCWRGIFLSLEILRADPFIFWCGP